MPEPDENQADAAGGSGAGAPSAAPTRREREREAHRQAVLRVAEGVFASRGFEGATIAEIARLSEFSVGSIYNFFPGKRELGEAVMLRICSERVEAVRSEALPLAADPPAGLDALMRVWARHHAEHGAFVRMGLEYQRTHGRHDPPEAFKRLFGQYVAAREEFFAAGAASRWYRDLPAADLGRVFEGVCHELFFEWRRAAPPRPESALLERLRAVVPAVLRR